VPRIASDLTWLVGSTPLVELSRLSPPSCRVVAKLESWSPTGSNKDRAVLAMIRAAERSGALQKGGTIVECTSGDFGVSIAAIGRRLGYRVVLVMPEGESNPRAQLARALGADLQFTPRDLGMRAAMELTEALQKRTPGAVCLQPFTNKANAQAHASSTALEIWNDTEGQVAVIIAPIGTGGTAAGCAAALRSKGVKVVGVEPASSSVMRGGKAGPHDIPGLGSGFVPEILPPSLLDEVVAVACNDARAHVRRLALEEGLLCGPASGAVVAAALDVARRAENAGKMVVAVLPDSAEHHLDHSAFVQED
jgi:cysteine synthase A